MSSHPGLCSRVTDWELVPAKDLVHKQQVIIIDSEASIEEACETLISKGISSVPIRDQAKKSHIGFFDYADFLTFLLQAFRQKRYGELEPHALTSLIGITARTDKISVKLVSDLSCKNPFYAVLPETSLLQVAEIFGQGTHRVAVMEGSGNLIGVMTQSNLVQYLAEKMIDVTAFPKLNPVVNQTIEELNLVNKDGVVSIDMDELVLDAMECILRNGISSIAVVDRQNVLFGNISLSDIKYVIQSNKQSLFYSPCHKFVAYVKREHGVRTGQDTVPVFDIHANSTLRLAMRKLTATRTHRLWITDSQGRLEGVLSLTDIIRVLVEATRRQEDQGE